jgi:hypothetical protein
MSLQEWQNTEYLTVGDTLCSKWILNEDKWHSLKTEAKFPCFPFVKI